MKLKPKLKLKLQSAVSRFVDPGICLIPRELGDRAGRDVRNDYHK